MDSYVFLCTNKLIILKAGKGKIDKTEGKKNKQGMGLINR